MRPKDFIDLLTEAGYSPRSYSGRGMYGKSCVGVDVDRSKSLFSVSMDIAYTVLQALNDPMNDLDGVSDTLAELCNLNVKEDWIGLDSIVYFPEMRWPDGI